MLESLNSAVSAVLQCVNTLFDGIPPCVQKAQKTTWYFVCLIFHRWNSLNKVVMKTSHTDIWIWSMLFLHRDSEIHFPPSLNISVVLCRSAVVAFCMGWLNLCWLFLFLRLVSSLLGASYKRFYTDDLQPLQIKPKIEIKESIWIQNQWDESLF